MNSNYYSDEIEINLMDLIFYLLKRWKILLAVVLIGAVIGGGAFALKEPEEKQSLPANSIEDHKVDPDVKANMDLAFQYRQLYAQQLEYNQKSFIMQMDPGEVYTGVLKYYIAAGEQTSPICEYFAGLLSEPNILEELKEAADLDCEEQYLNEIISVTVSKNDDSVVHSNDEIVFNDGVLVYTVSFRDSESCQRLLDVVQARAEAKNQELQSLYGEYRFENIQKTVKVTVNNDYLSRQKSSIDAINTYLSNFTKLETAFEEDDLEYYNAVYLGNKKKEIEVSEPIDIAEEPGTRNYKKEVIPGIVLGIVISFICWLMFYVLKYIFDNHVKSVRELQQYYGLHLLGRIEYSKKTSRGIDRLLSKMNRKRKGNPDTLEYIASMIRSLEAQHPLVCVDYTHQGAEEIINKLSKLCPNMSKSNLLYQDGETLEMARNMDGVILTVIVGYTSQRQLRRDLDICRLQEIPVLGVLVIDNV